MPPLLKALPTIDDYPARYRYQFCPLDGTPLERAMVNERERLRCPQCDWVFYPTPQVAATVVLEYEGGIVLARRNVEPDRGMWHLPIGHAEFGEHPRDAAARETWEETGLEVGDLRFLTYEHSRGYGDTRMWYLVFGFMGRAVGGALQTSAEISELCVVTLEEMPELKWASQRKTFDSYRRLREKGQAW